MQKKSNKSNNETEIQRNNIRIQDKKTKQPAVTSVEILNRKQVENHQQHLQEDQKRKTQTATTPAARI